MKKAYVLLYSDGVGRETLRDWLRKEVRVLHWRCDLPHAFYLVSECTATTLARSLSAFLKRRARFLIMEASENRQGWLPAETWEILRTRDRAAP